ncbi:MAG: TIGR02302 family protein [Magnetospirillum sp.]|nr:TIGR02302 family protein [Magnetospirillum sp.]
MKPVPPPADVPVAQPGIAAKARLRRWLRLAWAAVAWERLWPLVLPPFCLIGLFVAFALFDLAPLLPGWLHGLVLAALAGGVGFLSVRAALRFRRPDWDEAARRLERDSGLSHRPLAALADRPAGGNDDPLAQALWQAHQHRMAALLGGLRLNLPHPNMAARDPWGLRAAVLLLLVIAAAGAGHDAPNRLARALDPAVGSAGLGPDALEVWITPPAYTGLAPMLLRPPHKGDAPVAVPTGSAVLAVLAGGWGTARLVFDGHDQPFQRQGDGGQRAEARLDRSTKLTVRQTGLTVAEWPITVAADAMPSVAFALPPEAGERGRLRLALSASDDYGLARAWVNVRRVGVPGDEAPLEVEVPLPGGAPRSAEVGGWFDLTAHPWAGLPVSLQPAVKDGLGQVGTGEPVTITLPERQFANPAAAMVVEQRRRLTENPLTAPVVVDVLDRIVSEPELFNDDLRTFLMLRLAAHSLAADSFDLAEMQDLLWQAALRIEDGDLSSAERNLAEARRALEKAVDEGASANELQRLLDQFQEALDRYTQALAERMAAEGRPQPQAQADGRVISDEELRQMVQSLRDMAETGSREALRQMLGQLSQILDGLQAGAQQQQANGPASEGMQRLRDIARSQRQMLDDSHQRAQQQEGGEGARPGARGAGPGQQAAQAQEALRRALTEAARKLGEGLGEAPSALAEADRAMAEAAQQLGQGQWAEGAEAQAAALGAMQQAAREALEQLGASGQGMQSLLPRDPLGRPMRGTGGGDDGTTRVPDGAEVQRSRQLLEEIRRRAGEFQRPEAERDYLRRLLKQF